MRDARGHDPQPQLLQPPPQLLHPQHRGQQHRRHHQQPHRLRAAPDAGKRHDHHAGVSGGARSLDGEGAGNLPGVQRSVPLHALRRVRDLRRGGHVPRSERAGKHLRQPLCDGKRAAHRRLQRLSVHRHGDSDDRGGHAGELGRLSAPARSVRQGLSGAQRGRHVYRNRAAAGRRVRL